MITGSKYERGVDVAEIAKRVRADIKAAVKAESLPAAKYGVRIARFSGGQSLTITASSLPFEVSNEAYVLADHSDPRNDRINRLSDAAKAVERALESIGAAYNFDGSDSQSDYFNVNFYLHIDLAHDEAAERAAILARHGRAA